MNSDEFQKHLNDARKIVESWPKWKQNILKHSASPTVSAPREPVCNYNLEQQRIQKLEAENYRMKQILAAAEQLYEAATEGLGWLIAQEWDVSLSAINALEKALSDYTNAKEQK